MRLGNRGVGSLFVWIYILVAIFLFSMTYIAFDNFVQNQSIQIAQSFNSTLGADTITNTILPIWRLLPWGFAFSLMMYGIFTRPETPEGLFG